MTEQFVDLEPTWEAIIKGVCNGAFDLKKIESELIKLAKLGDVIRQAQKKNQILVSYPDGKLKEAVVGEVI